MATMKLSEVVAELQRRIAKHGDVPAVLWDLDSGSYFSLAVENFEAQRMEDGSVRVSVGLNGWDDAKEDEPASRPLP